PVHVLHGQHQWLALRLLADEVPQQRKGPSLPGLRREPRQPLGGYWQVQGVERPGHILLRPRPQPPGPVPPRPPVPLPPPPPRASPAGRAQPCWTTPRPGRYGTAWPYARHCPLYQVTWSGARPRPNSVSSRVLPIPGGPTRLTTWPSPARTASKRSCSRASSRCCPTNELAERGRRCGTPARRCRRPWIV